MTPIARWLRALGLDAYVELFERELIDLDTLPHLGDADLKALGLPTGPRVKVLAAARELKQTIPLFDRTASSSRSADHSDDTVVGVVERRQLTVLFCDLVGSTSLSQTLDPEQLRELMQAYQQACRAVIERYDGHVAQYLGDGLMVYFGWPRAHEDDAERAVRASLLILEAVKRVAAPAPLHVRIGIATGPVVVGETGAGDASVPKLAVGETPNLAARLQGLAGADEIVVAPTTHRLLGGAFEYADLGSRTLKGILDPVQAWRVLGAGQSEGRFEAAHAQSGLTPLVGREEELALLLRRWADAKAGEGQLVLLSGEPGIGKSRITRALRERIDAEPHIRLRYQCSPFHTQSALFPVIEQLERAAGFNREDTGDAKLDKLEALLAQGLRGDRLPAVAPLFAALLSLPTDRYTPLNLSPQKQKEKTLEALFEQVAGLSKRHPLLMVFEDVHWLDPTTQESLDLLTSRIVQLPVLVLVTFRPEFTPRWSGEAHVTTLSLNRLNRKLGAQLAARVTGGKALPDEVLDQIVAKTDGVPLFVEELTKTVVESGLLKDSGDHYELIGPMPSLAIPSTLHDSLMARLDRLAPVKETAQIGACIGREFSHALLAAASPLAESELADALEQLVHSQLVFRQGTAPEARYTFKHALIQDAAYGSLLKSRRQQLHGKIAKLLVETASHDTDARPELIARQFTEAGLVADAIHWWTKAGEWAGHHSANTEAVAHYRRALELLCSLPESSDRNAREVELQVALGYAYVRQISWAAEPVRPCFARAAELCSGLGDAQNLIPALVGTATFFVTSGDQRRARTVAQQTLELARKSSDTGHLVEAHSAMAATLFFSSDLAAAIRHCDEALALYDPEQHRAHAFVYGQDPKVAVLSWRSWALLAIGHLDQALEAAKQALDGARALDHLPSLAWGYAALGTVHAARGDELAEEMLRSSMELCRQGDMPYWENMFSFYLGNLLIQGKRRYDEGLRLLQEMLSAHQAMGNANCLTQIFASLAEGHCRLGQLEDASTAIRTGLEHVSRSGEHFWEPELYRVAGEVELARPAPDKRAAEEHFRRAIECARLREQRICELRADMGLARLWYRQAKGDAAKRLLQDTYNAFTEGFDGLDLVEARELLQQLG